MACVTNPKSRVRRSLRQPRLVRRPCPVSCAANIAPVHKWFPKKSWANHRQCARLLAKRLTKPTSKVVNLFLWLDRSVRLASGLIATISMAMLAFGLYLQHSQGLDPCPMCIVQRYALLFLAIIALLISASGKKSTQMVALVMLASGAGFGAFVAARQSWLQWFPPEVATCGRDFYGMIESYPLSRAIPMIFKGSGDCAAIDWAFLGGSIANWAFVWFCGVMVLALTILWRRVLRPRR